MRTGWAGSVTVEKKLTNFLKKEREAEQDFDSDIVKAYLRKSPFKLVEQPDNMEVQLKRTLGNEECAEPAGVDGGWRSG